MKYPDRNMPGNPEPEHPHACSNLEFGNRCTAQSSLSYNTFGGGPWLCRAHFFRDPHPQSFPRYDSIAHLPPEQRRDDNRNWARRILYRASLDESVPTISLTMAHQALGIPEPKPEMRHTGQG